MTDYSRLRALVGERLKLSESLARYTVARLGGPADALVSVDSDEMLLEVMGLAWESGWPTRILGGGANVLVSDTAYRGLIVINNTRATQVTEDGTVGAESGAALNHLARQTMSRGLAGFEWAVSVPGTLGGAIVNNAGAHGGDMASCLVSAEVAFPGRRATWLVTQLA